MNAGLQSLFNLRKDFLVIGLTGRTGSGCSTAAGILSTARFDDCLFPTPKFGHFDTNEERKDNIIYHYAKENWAPFVVIKVSSVITSIILKNSFDAFVSYVVDQSGLDTSAFEAIRNEYDRLHALRVELDSVGDVSLEEKQIKIVKSYEFHFESGLDEFVGNLKQILLRNKNPQGFTMFQLFGNNIRSSGNALYSDFKYGNSYRIASLINKLIKVLREYKKGRIIIDSIRNSLEAMFFKERYAAFYLIAINSEDNYRFDRLASVGLNRSEIEELDNKEYSSKKGGSKFFAQDIKTRIQISDIYIHNPNDDYQRSSLKKQIAKYVSLIQHPGLVTPSPEERCMQIAYTAKYNSGCISRQVGAAVTDQSFSLKALGWNNTAEGQTPCLLRSVTTLKDNSDRKAFSNYELENEKFRLTVIEKFSDKLENPALKGRNVPFCFKDAQNELEGQRNQVHTRSLHAEENAFLQISKYGGEGVKGGMLFTTASPCELCSKKAYQIGIKKVFYIDPYPGIAGEQILQSGGEEYRPKLVLFSGAIGRAYHQLYEPIMAYKDEMYSILDISY